MTVTLDPATAAILERLLARDAFPSAEDALAAAVRLLDEHCPDDWLFRNRDYVRAALEESSAQAARGEGYTPEESRAILAQRRAARKAKAA